MKDENDSTVFNGKNDSLPAFTIRKNGLRVQSDFPGRSGKEREDAIILTNRGRNGFEPNHSLKAIVPIPEARQIFAPAVRV
jgi:hypothetical protein